jgi:hypothetical protein
MCFRAFPVQSLVALQSHQTKVAPAAHEDTQFAARTVSATDWPCDTNTSTCRSLADRCTTMLPVWLILDDHLR